MAEEAFFKDSNCKYLNNSVLGSVKFFKGDFVPLIFFSVKEIRVSLRSNLNSILVFYGISQFSCVKTLIMIIYQKHLFIRTSP